MMKPLKQTDHLLSFPLEALVMVALCLDIIIRMWVQHGEELWIF